MNKLLWASLSAFNEIPNTQLRNNREGFKDTYSIAASLGEHLTGNAKPGSDVETTINHAIQFLSNEYHLDETKSGNVSEAREIVKKLKAIKL